MDHQVTTYSKCLFTAVPHCSFLPLSPSPYLPSTCIDACLPAHPSSPGIITVSEKRSPSGHLFHSVSVEGKLRV